jgi:hypothetical protein
MRLGLSIVLITVCLGLVSCGGSNEATPAPTTLAPAVSGAPRESAVSTPTPPPADSYPGAVVGKYRTVDGEPYVTESGTGTYYQIRGIEASTPLGQDLFVIGRVTPVPNVHVIQATQVTTIPETGSVSCQGTLAKRNGRYFVESSAAGGCGSVELIEVDTQKLDAKVGQQTGLTVRYCTVTKEGRMVKADLDPDFTCAAPSS